MDDTTNTDTISASLEELCQKISKNCFSDADWRKPISDSYSTFQKTF